MRLPTYLRVLSLAGVACVLSSLLHHEGCGLIEGGSQPSVTTGARPGSLAR